MDDEGISVQVYWALLPNLGDVATAGGMLSGDLGGLVNLRNDHRRRQFLAGRCLLRFALQDCYGAVSLTWSFDGAGGKPSLLGEGAPNISLSHSRELVLCALADVPLGVDVEYCQPRDFHALAEFICGPGERQAFLRLSEEHQELAFYRLWSAKEATYKLHGGELYPEVCVDLDLVKGLPEKWSVMAGAGPQHMAWLPLPHGYMGAIAIQSAMPLHLDVHADCRLPPAQPWPLPR
jgi:4'-phosphopantetheinyl transferase